MLTTSVTDVIERIEAQPGLLSDNWCVPRETGRFLYLMARFIQARSICEVGTYSGYSTLWLAQGAAQNGGMVDTLEYFESRQQQAKAHIGQAGLTSTVTFHLGQAIDLLKQFQSQGRRFDLAFIDAAKKEYIDYVRLLETMMPSGACLIADNTRSHRGEMSDFLQYMQETDAFEIAEIETPNGQLLARRQ